jgi:mannose-6-phosphate isomerase-like protein (cupin superfamily)
MPPGASDLPHFHRLARQLFFVLEGRLQIEVNQERFDLEAGDSLVVPPERIHRVHNRSDSDVLFLLVSAPSTTGDRENVDVTPRTEPPLTPEPR